MRNIDGLIQKFECISDMNDLNEVHGIDMPAMNAEFLKYLGSQTHVNCNVHKLPMIRSSKKE
eukprot:11146998-Ditylum_brightwellii.AAC.1